MAKIVFLCLLRVFFQNNNRFTAKQALKQMSQFSMLYTLQTTEIMSKCSKLCREITCHSTQVFNISKSLLWSVRTNVCKDDGKLLSILYVHSYIPQHQGEPRGGMYQVASLLT